MQLVAYGAQDIYLTGNPQITFFKVVYRRHTNFSMEAIEQTLNGVASEAGSTLDCTISRNGDLVTRLWMDVVMPAAILTGTTTAAQYTNWTNNTGHALLKSCELEIGGQLIDRHYSHWLDVWNELSDHDEAEWSGLNKHSAKNTYLTLGGVGAGAATTNMPQTVLYVPLQFWFCKNPGLALPLIALQYHEVKVKLVTRATTALINSNAAAFTGITVADPIITLWADYVYLDTDERRRFAQVSHEYLIEQVQQQTGTRNTMELNFNHPVKELIWTVQTDAASIEGGVTLATTNAVANVDGTVNQGNDYFCYSSTRAAPTVMNGQSSNEGFGEFHLELNGHERFAPRRASYFRTCQPLQAGHKIPSKHIYCYSFALKPEEHQPSGTCNFSRIDNAQMMFTGIPTVSTLTVYAVNYNVLRIMSGMGGLAYSN
jgi:hypothetical protein